MTFFGGLEGSLSEALKLLCSGTAGVSRTYGASTVDGDCVQSTEVSAAGTTMKASKNAKAACASAGM